MYRTVTGGSFCRLGEAMKRLVFALCIALLSATADSAVLTYSLDNFAGSNDGFFDINTDGGSSVQRSVFSEQGRFGSFSTQPSTGVVFGTRENNDRELYTVDPNTGVLTYIGNTSPSYILSNIAFDPNSGQLYGLLFDRVFAVGWLLGPALGVLAFSRRRTAA